MKHLGDLLRLKLTLAKNSFRRVQKRSGFEFFTLILFFIAAAFGLFFFFYYGFRFFRRQEPFGPILIDETFYLFNFVLFVMLAISSAVSSYASLFRSREVPFLILRPVAWSEIYFIKLIEALWFSSWSFLLIAVPFMTAYGLNKDIRFVWFPLLCFIFYIPFVALAGMLGTLAATLCVWLLPSRARRRAALMISGAAVILFFAHAEPKMIHEQGSIAGIMSGYLPHVAFAKNVILPSSWATRGILALGDIDHQPLWGWREGIFNLLLLISNAMFFLIPSYSAAGKLYPKTFLKAQDHAEVQTPRRVRVNAFFEDALDRIPWPKRPPLALLEKDIKIFLRDPTEWSQLIIFFGLLLIYFANIKNLEFHVLKDFWKNIVFVLNTVGTYVVLSSFSMRFVFPMLSMEGSKFWMIYLAPIRFSSLVLEKFLMGTIVSVMLTMPLVFLSGWMLEIPLARVFFTTGLGFFVCVALTGLSVGLGAKFPNFKSNNPSEIISGFGGSFLLMAHLAYLALIGVFLMLTHRPQWLVFWTAAAASLLIGAIPLKLGVRALKRMEF